MVFATRPVSSRKSTDIAVIGMGCLFPDANGLAEYWQRVKQGHDAIGPVPLSHWRPEDYFDADPKKPDHTYASTGGFLKPYAFDPLKFGMAPHALEATDSTQLLGMVCAHEALLNAGYGPEKSFNRDRVSCVIGVTGTLELVIPLGARLGHPIWKAALDKAGVPQDQAQAVMDAIAASYVGWQEASFPGLLGNVVAGRIASRLDLGGTNSVVDAACASSLAAVHLAVMELQSGRADMVISGGMDTFNDIFMYMCFSKTPALSPTGAARPYDAEGDGTILGEGLGAVVLKRLDDAERDGDRIYAVLRSVGSSSDGKGQAIYAPSAKGQAKALARAYELADVSARSIELLEGHGTGTKVGDGVELEALTRVYREVDQGAAWCQLGSVKSQIGHTKAAAGAAGLIKAAMALHHKVLPPTIKVKEPHPRLLDSPFVLADKARPWVGNRDYPRRAAVSAFGFGGSNYHAVLEEYQPTKTALDWDPELQIIAFSAPDAAGLSAAVEQAQSLVQKGWTAQGLGRRLRRQFQPGARERLSFVVSSQAMLVERLAAVQQLLRETAGEKQAPWLYRGRAESPGKLAFIFAGQGSQEPGMLRELSCLFPEFLVSLQQGNEILQSFEPEAQRLSERIYPGQAFSEAAQKEQRQNLTETRYAQLALGTLGCALLDLFKRFGVQADAVAGHSYGELLALHAAGVLPREALLRLSYQRGQLMKSLGKPDGAMLAVMASEADIERVLNENKLPLEWANYNADKQIVLGADTELCQRAAAAFKKAGMGCRRLEVSTAFHTSFVEPAAAAFLEALEAQAFHEAELAVYANRSAQLYPEARDEQKRLLSRQLAEPVRFAPMLRQMRADGITTFIEVGPQKKLLGLLKAAAGDAHCLALDAEPGSSLLGFAQLLAQLASLGYPLQLTAWDAGPEPSEAAESKSFTVMISGANYRNPRKTESQKEVRKPAAIPAPAQTETIAAASRPTAAAAASPAVQAAAKAPGPSATPSLSGPAAAQRPASDMKVRFPQEGTMSSSNDSWQRLEKIMQDMHEIQRKTADAHTLFLENQRQFQSLLHNLIKGEPAAVATHEQPAAKQPGPVLSPAAPAVRQPVVSRPQVAPRTVAAAPATSLSPAPAAQQTAPSPSTAPAPAPAPAPEKRTPAAAVAAPMPKAEARLENKGEPDVDVYAILAQCTGYPAELLRPEMNLEADLGIDSIKKVEIFSQLQSRLPHMEADSSRLGELQTIGDLLQLSQGSATPSVKEERAGAWAAGTVALAASAPAQGEQAILDIIAEKTGFPVAMLQPGMDLEADLGIDSIKKVEIFSVVQERLPQLGSLGAEELNRLRSIADLFALLGSPEQPAAADEEPSPLTRIMSSGAEDLVFQVLADKTGYPREVLGPSMSLESDLGIDSIKRVEIFSALAELVPGMQTATQDKIGALVTVADLLQLAREGLGEAEKLAEQSLLEPDHRHADWDLSKKKSPVEPSATEVLAAAASPQKTEAAAEDQDSLAALRVQRLEVEAFPSLGNARSWQPGSEVWIGDDGSNLARNIMLKLQERGLRARLVSLAQAERLQVPEQLHALIILAPLKLDLPPIRWLGHAFKLLRRCGPALAQAAEESLVAVVTRNGGRFGLDGLQSEAQVYGGALSALAKTVREEWPGIHARTLDLGRDFTDGIEAALRCLDGLLLAGPVELGMSRDQVVQLSLHEQDLSSSAGQDAPLQKGDLILVTGGARGVTAASLLPLARVYKARLHIWGRTELSSSEPEELRGLQDPAALKKTLLQLQPELRNPRELEAAFRQLMQQRELRANLQQLQEAGAIVSYEAVDVSKDAELRQAFQKLQQTHGTPVGLIHGAGVIRDKWILEQKDEEFFEVLDTKLRLLPYIEECAKQGLKWVLLFSSSTARFGRKGQVAYGVANEALNKFAQYISAQYPGCRAMACNWGPWAGGMVNDGLKKLFAAEGVATIPLESGAALVQHLITQPLGPVHELVVLARAEPLELENVEAVRRLAEFTISVPRVPVLLDHVIKQRAVVPAALLLEWLAAAAQNLDPKLQLREVRDFKVWKGIVLDAQQELPVWIEQVSTAEPAIELVLCSQNQGKKLRHARAQLLLGPALETAPVHAGEALPLDPLCQGLNPYAEILFHGEQLHLLQTIESCTQQGLDATLALKHKPADWSAVGLPDNWIVSGELVDAVFQAAIVWSTLQLGRPCLPSQLGQLEIFQKLPAESCRLQLRVRRTESMRLIADAALVNGQGELLMRLSAFEAVMDLGLSQAFRQSKLSPAMPGIGAV